MTTPEMLESLVTQLLARQPTDPSNLGLSEAQRRKLTDLPPPQSYRYIPCTSEETGATFVAHVVASSKFPNGRITRLEEYTLPAGASKFVAAGGLIPDGMPIGGPNRGSLSDPTDVPSSELSTPFKIWRWETFWQSDLRRLVGKEIKAHFCSESGAGKGLDTPWIESRVDTRIDGLEE